MRRLLLIATALALGGLGASLATPFEDGNELKWEPYVSPGRLSSAHSFLERDCAACHQRITGVQSSSCIACHANETTLLQRQSTAFHADVGSCVECHIEHQQPTMLIAKMNHTALAGIGLRLLGASPTNSEAQALHHALEWIEARGVGSDERAPTLERSLDCYGCHATRDAHSGQFGAECIECHSTDGWAIAEFRHPPPSSIDCAECHRAPPSHYMGHFEMMSKRVARVEHAQVSECYLCHRTTSWNDIRGVGFYDHH